MNKGLLGFIAVALVCLISCEKEKLDSPGNIQGMGYTSGKLEVKESFKLPQGIYLIGEISGLENPGAKDGELKSAYDSKSGYPCFGSGKFVKLSLTLVNSGSNPKTVFFPKGLLWQCKSINYQHAVCLQTSWVCLHANSSRTFIIDLYCINHGIPAPDQNATYKILGISSSKTMWNLLDKIGWRKINYEMIYHNSGKKGIAEEPTYEEITDKLQTIVWNLTNNGIDVTAADEAFIKSIPELSVSEIPQIDAQSQYPDYFDEFVVPGK